MAFADPQTVVIGTTPGTVTLPRTGLELTLGEFKSNDANTQIQISHQYAKRNRHTARLNFQKIAPDPLVSSSNILYSMSTYLVVDVPKTGFTVVEASDVVKALNNWLSATSFANLTKLLGGES